MIVRSAVKAVSKTRSNPICRKAVVIAPADVRAGLQAELFGQRDRDGRGVLHDDHPLGIGNGVDHRLDVRWVSAGHRSGRP